MKYLPLLFISLNFLATCWGSSDVAEVEGSVIEAKRPYKLSVANSLSSNMVGRSEKTYINATSVTGSYALNGDWSFSSKIAFTKELVDDRESFFEDLPLTLRRVVPNPWTNIELYSSLSAYLPASKVSVKRDSLRTAINFAVTDAIDLSKWMKGVEVVLVSSMRKNFHQYTQGIKGTENISYRLMGSAAVSYSFNDQWSLGLENVFYKSVTYNGRQIDSYIFDVGLSFNFLKDLTASVGHSIGGNMLAADGTSLEVNFFNRDDSTLYTALSYSY